MQLTTILLGWQLKIAPWLPRLLLNPRAIKGVIVYPVLYKSEPKMAPLGTQFLYKS